MRTEDVEAHRVAPERFAVPAATAAAVNRALDEGRRVIAVGTTTTRTLEAVARAHGGRLEPGAGETDLYIRGRFDFGVVGGLLTNFHLPRSSLLLLVSAFAGRETVLAAYREAIDRRYRFYSYGDAMNHPVVGPESQRAPGPLRGAGLNGPAEYNRRLRAGVAQLVRASAHIR